MTARTITAALLLSGASLTATSGPAFAQETVVYDRAPVDVALPIGAERMVTFPEKVQVGVTRDVHAKVRIQTVDDTLYLTARQALGETRVPVRGVVSNKIYLVDLRAEEGAPDEHLFVRVEGDAVQQPSQQQGAADGRDQRTASTETAPESHGYAAMTRYAAQAVYAPERLIEPLEGVQRVAVQAEWVANLVEGVFVEARPIASWRDPAGLYVTAIMLRNRTSETVPLDPRLIRGDYATTTLHHQHVGPRGATADTTTAYVTHDRRFEEAAKSWLR